MDILDAVLAAQIAKNGSGGGGGSVTAGAVATAISQMTSAQAAQARSDLGAEPEKFVVAVTETGNTFSADKTFAEISAAISAGKIVEFSVTFGTAIGVTTDVLYETSTAVYGFIVLKTPSMTEARCYIVSIASNDTVTVTGRDLEFATNLIEISGASANIAPVANSVYKCGTLTSLTISNPPATGSYVIKFTSGSTATTTAIPASIIFPEAFAAEANTRYEINVEDGYALAVGWPTT